MIELKAKIEQDSRTETNRLTADDVKEIHPDADAVQMSVDPARRQNGNQAGGHLIESGQGSNPVQSNGNGNGSNGSGAPFATPVLLRLDSVRDTLSAISMIQDAAAQFPGERPLHIEVTRANGHQVVLEAGPAFCVSDEFVGVRMLSGWIAKGTAVGA